MLQSEMWIQKEVKDCACFGILMEANYCIFALIILLNMIQIIWYKFDFLCFLLKMLLFRKPTYIQVLIKKQYLKLE